MHVKLITLSYRIVFLLFHLFIPVLHHPQTLEKVHLFIVSGFAFSNCHIVGIMLYVAFQTVFFHLTVNSYCLFVCLFVFSEDYNCSFILTSQDVHMSFCADIVHFFVPLLSGLFPS